MKETDRFIEFSQNLLLNDIENSISIFGRLNAFLKEAPRMGPEHWMVKGSVLKNFKNLLFFGYSVNKTQFIS